MKKHVIVKLFFYVSQIIIICTQEIKKIYETNKLVSSGQEIIIFFFKNETCEK